MTQTFSLSATDILLIFKGLDMLKHSHAEVNKIDREDAQLLRTRLMIEIMEREKGNYGMVDEKIFLQMKAEYDKGGKFKDFVDKASQLYEDTPDDEMHKLIIYEYYKSIQKGGCNER